MAVGVAAILGVLCIIALAIAGKGVSRHISEKSVLVFNLDTQIVDGPVDESSRVFDRLMGRGSPAIQLRSATTALRAAAADSRISGLYLRGNLRTGNYSSGYGALRELREAVQEFQKSGKPVIAYITEADNRDYYLESVADDILLHPLGLLAFRGLAAEGMFLKGAEDKYGLEMTPTRHGKYKSAVEPFIRENFSPENREQLDALLSTIWKDIRDSAAASRKLNPADLQALVDKDGLITAKTAKEKGFVTDLAYEGAALEKLRELAGKPKDSKTFPQIALANYAAQVALKAAGEGLGKDKIAVLYAEGAIVEGSGGRRQEGEVAGGRFAGILREIREKKDVKALVLRVNSPGGSGVASDVILDELRRFNADRPVIVSMGTVAASGGYFISMASRKIVAEPTTITGSIGVFGLSVNAQKLANDHGVTFDTVKTANLADFFTISRPMTDGEKTRMQDIIDNFYNGFLERVAANRKLSTNRVDELAQGRVWSGADALKNGLVDEMGGLQKAIDIAAQEANLGSDYAVTEFPARKRLLEQLIESLDEERRPVSKTDLAGRILEKVRAQLEWLASMDDPEGIYARLPFDLDLN
jgi:protease-4